MMHLFRRIAREEEGAAAVELALVTPMFLIFVFGIMSLTQAFWIRNSLQYAVSEGGRYAMLNSSASDSTIQSEVLSKIYGRSTTGINVSVSSAPVSGVNYKTITATYSFVPFNGMINLPTITLSSQTRVPVIP